MLQDGKLANHGKQQVTGDNRSQISTANQQAPQHGTAGYQGPKSIGSHGVKTNQISPSTPGLKTVGQLASNIGGMLKTKTKRERSVSIDSSESRNAIPQALEKDAKGEGVVRSKRRCVLEKKQPYSGDEWCSGPETEEDEDKPHSAAHRGPLGPIKGLSDRLSSGPMSDPGGPVVGCAVGPGLKVESSQSSQQVVYVFTTNLANSAAEAVLTGQSESILLFHQQNVQRSKLEQGHPSGKAHYISDKINSISSPPMGTPISQSGTSQTSSSAAGGPLHPVGAPSSAGHSDNETLLSRAGEQVNRSESRTTTTSAGPGPGGGDGESVDAMSLPGSSVSPSAGTSILSAHLQGDVSQRSGPGNIDGLSKEQLAHRERSLQTLRHLERMLLRSRASGGPGEPDGSTNNDNNNPSSLNVNISTDRMAMLEDNDNGTNNSGKCGNSSMLSAALAPAGGMKKYEEPLQSIYSQTQPMCAPALNSPQMDSMHNLSQHPHHPLSSPGVDMGSLIGPDGLSPEQMAWRKLQEEYYQEKRRRQEMQPSAQPQHFRVMSEMGVHGGPMLMRAPPPPYHSKPGEQHWPPGNLFGGMGGNPRMMEMHQEGPRGPRFLGPMQRGQPREGGFPSSPGESLSLEELRAQRPNRSGMTWLDEINRAGPLRGILPGPVRKYFSVVGIGRGPHSGQGDPMDCPGSRDTLGPTGMGPQIRDLVDAQLGVNAPMNMNLQMNVQQQQQIMLSQKLGGGPASGGPLDEMFSPGDMTQVRASQNGQGGNKGVIRGLDGPYHFPNQSPFPEGQMEGSYQLHGLSIFGSEQQNSNQMGSTSRLSHMPVSGSLRGANLRPTHPSDLTVNVNSMTSPSLPPHQLKSPSLNQEPSPALASPTAAGLKSPSQSSSAGHHPPLPPASGAGTPSYSSMKSPQVMASSNLGLHSPSASSGGLKSPAMAVASPGWTSPKTALPSPGGPAGGKIVGNGGSSSTETGQSLPPRSSNSTPSSQPGSVNPSMPFTTSPDGTSNQNPLSLIMTQMSKYAMPSTTPLYHEAIKAIATSDDEMMPDRPLLSGISIGGNIGNLQGSQLLVSHGSGGPHSEPQSPVGMMTQGQLQMSHSSPNRMGMPPMNSAMMGGAEGMGPCNISPIAEFQMGGFPRLPPQSHGPMHSPIGAMSQNFPQSNEDSLPHQQLHLLSKGHSHHRSSHPSDSFGSLPMGEGPDLSEVIRPTHTGIPEFDLSRIIPSDKPSSTLQYFPKSEQHQNSHQGPPSQQPTPQQLLKQLSSQCPPHSSGPSSNPHIANLQNMMAEQQLLPHPSHGIRPGMGVPQGGLRGMIPGGGMSPMCPPGHMMGRTGLVPQQQLQQQQAMMANSLLHHPSNPYPGMMSPQQHPHNLTAQQNIMMMQAKQRSMSIPGDPFGPQGSLISPQGPMMAPPHPQSGMMGPQSLRQRGMSLDSPIGYGPGGMTNMPF